ncbi:MAG TPA: maleylpyruvate isomerase N-terminal domain-containing protein [Candidatus Limnocylindria bacterium]|nr:maleylpyruvate isomerase N-terminal domain-containing protein [Candidatus Limnocylindria bacterium]
MSDRKGADVSAFWPEPLKVAQLMKMVTAERANWEAVLARVPRERLTEPGLPGGWSVKDVLAHMTWAMKEGIGVMRAKRLVGSDLWKLDDDQRNAIVVEQSRARLLEAILADYESTSADYMKELAALTDDQLNDPVLWPKMPPDWRPWRIIYDPHHYGQHALDLREWLDRSRS